MKNLVKISPFLLAVVMLLWSGCASTKKSKTSVPSYIGTWDYVLSMPEGDQEGFIIFRQEDDQVIGTLGSDQGEIQLSDLVINEENLTANFDYQGYTVNMFGDFEGNQLKGNMAVEGFELPYVATKQEEN
jgi:hypothetical protein